MSLSLEVTGWFEESEGCKSIQAEKAAGLLTSASDRKSPVLGPQEGWPGEDTTQQKLHLAET